jgi:hypothetical protein
VNGSSASAILILPHYELHGDVPTGSGRLLDVLNDQSTRFLKMAHVRFVRRGSNHIVSEVSNSVVVKSNIHLALLVDEDRPNYTKFFYATQERKTLDSLITLPTMLIEGRIHLKTAADPQSFLSIEAGTFFPVTNATIHYSASSEPTDSPVVLINKEAVSSLSFH